MRWSVRSKINRSKATYATQWTAELNEQKKITYNKLFLRHFPYFFVHFLFFLVFPSCWKFSQFNFSSAISLFLSFNPCWSIPLRIHNPRWPFKRTTPRLRYPKSKQTFFSRRIHAPLFVFNFLYYFFFSAFSFSSSLHFLRRNRVSTIHFLQQYTLAHAQCILHMIICVIFDTLRFFSSWCMHSIFLKQSSFCCCCYFSFLLHPYSCCAHE